MLHPSTKKLIDRLSEMTLQDKLAWTEGDADTVNYVTEGYSVALTADPNELIITSKDGVELERAGVEDLAATPTESGESYSDVLAAMTKEAHRIARGTESAISTLLADIDDVDAPAEAETQAPEVEEAGPEDGVDETTVMDAEELADINSVSAQPSEENTEDDETNVTAAVARLAEEVNGREEDEDTENEAPIGALSAAASGLATTVAMAEHAPDATEDISEPTAEAEQIAEDPVEDKAETAETTGDETTAEPAMVLTPALEDHKYVPFGLNGAADVAPIMAMGASTVETAPQEIDAQEMATEAQQAPENLEQTTEAVETVEPSSEASESVQAEEADQVLASVTPESSAPEQDNVVNITEAPQTAEADVADMASEPLASSYATEWSKLTPSAGNDAEPHAAESEPAEAVEEDFTSAPDAAVEPEFGAVETVELAASEAEAEAEAASEPEGEPAQPQESEPDETSATFATLEPPKSYSLSGIGAGFGLGALTAKTEASGVPSASPSGASDDKIIIDATDDVPFVQSEDNETEEAAPSLPEVSDLEPPHEIAAEPEPKQELETADSSPEDATKPSQKPRTRFNPWS